MQYISESCSPLNRKSPSMANGMVVERPTVTVSGDVNSIALTQQKSETNVIRQLTKMIKITSSEEGNWNFSTPV
ncbi:hypothetical protein WICPIJ_008130 [Wickerhamomyces pijperi]|uniref:Uncharacterized protein n=1 Tax=Wickerhamomyces pijperi TaxID=599730 RepID=A0A9P8TIF5_WICPI|nr:hypothetical protein WICPIJ_008130 [Wickerhamomyces pijperi]